jgi:pyruvate formate-lyase activating enzyme-like uncharacterized protein
VAWVHQFHAAEGESGSTTMVMVYGVCHVVCAFCAVSNL